MTKEQLETVAQMLRSYCMEELFPGVHSMVFTQRDVIKEMCAALELWEPISRDLKAVKAMSANDQVGCCSAGLYDSPFARPPVYARAMIVISTNYDCGELTEAKAVMLLGEKGKEELVALVGRSIVDGLETKMQREHPGCKLRSDLSRK